MKINDLLNSWKHDPRLNENMVAWQINPSRSAVVEEFPPDLNSELVEVLQSQGIDHLYCHQSQCWDLIKSGKNIVITTGTASGKTYCYNLPVYDYLLEDNSGRALYLFPTKALAQDQYQKLTDISKILKEKGKDIVAAIYDGDTPSTSRSAIRANARIVISNPDMLHIGILPHHTNWADFFRNLRFIIIDEAHIYRGVFGAHVTNVIRRLNRIANYYGSYPQFISTTATIANPLEHIQKLTEQTFSLVSEDGARKGEKHFIIYNPPIINKELGIRLSALQESIRLSEDLLAFNVQTIIFGRSRRIIELTLIYLREKIRASFMFENLNPEELIRGYRGGYLPGQRRNIEKELRQGKTRLVAATNALELGIDIGEIGAALMIGYPGAIASTRQQAGRAGRGSDASLAVLVCTSDPLDQFLARHPEFVLGKSPEQALIDPDNVLILLAHMRCAAFELPFNRGESFGKLGVDLTDEYLQFLESESQIFHSKDKYFWMADQYPAQSISLRTASAFNISLKVEQDNRTQKIGEVDIQSAYWMVHPKAVYLHDGQNYVVEDLDLENHSALLSRKDTDYYTLPVREMDIQLINQIAQAKITRANMDLANISYGEVTVTTQVKGFRKLLWLTNEPSGVEELEMPPSSLQTTAFWLALTDNLIDQLRQEGMWRNDRNNYGPQWNNLREKVRQRDNYRCQHCGALEKNRAHDVHHKIPLRAFSSLEQANQMDNLITLCHNCHKLAESALRIRSGLAGLAYVLGHLAPLYLMCDPADLGIHNDARLQIANNQPGVVIYDNIPAGIGLSERLYQMTEEIFLSAYELISSCPCADGCPSCVGPGGENGAGGKQETLAIIKLLRQ